MIIVAVCGVNDCLYCIVAHGALLRIYADAPCSPSRSPRTIARPTSPRRTRRCSTWRSNSPNRPPVSGTTTSSGWTPASPTSHLGHRRVPAFFNLSNRLAQLADIRPNDEFYNRAADAASVLTARSHVASAGRTVQRLTPDSQVFDRRRALCELGPAVITAEPVVLFSGAKQLRYRVKHTHTNTLNVEPPKSSG